jgi:hypothetical protein
MTNKIILNPIFYILNFSAIEYSVTEINNKNIIIYTYIFADQDKNKVF